MEDDWGWYDIEIGERVQLVSGEHGTVEVIEEDDVTLLLETGERVTVDICQVDEKPFND